MSLKYVLNMHLLVAKHYKSMMKIYFANFSEWDAVVVPTSDCYNAKISKPMLIILHHLKKEFCALYFDINISKRPKVLMDSLEKVGPQMMMKLVVIIQLHLF